VAAGPFRVLAGEGNLDGAVRAGVEDAGERGLLGRVRNS
jgi:hypothetical protein